MKSSDLVKIVLANAPLQNGNRGCAALTVSLLYIINRLFENSNVSVEFLLPDAQIKSWDFKNVCSIEDKIIKVIPITYNAPDSLLSSIKRFVWSFVKRLLGPYLKIHNKRNMFKDADYILNIGQGDSFADIYGKERFDLIDRANRYTENLTEEYSFMNNLKSVLEDYCRGKENTIKIVMLKEFSRDLGKVLELYKPQDNSDLIEN